MTILPLRGFPLTLMSKKRRSPSGWSLLAATGKTVVSWVSDAAARSEVERNCRLGVDDPVVFDDSVEQWMVDRLHLCSLGT